MNFSTTLLLSTVLSIRTPPDYRHEQVGMVLDELALLTEGGQLEEVITRGEEFQRNFEPSADICYEMGLASRLLERSIEALDYYERALELAPLHAAARYDRGEILLALGDVAGAKEDFRVAAEQVPEHWVVHYRLAHIAAEEINLPELEFHLDNSVANGLDFQVLEADASWRAWARDAAIGPVLRRVVLRYSTEAMWIRLGGEP